MDQISPRFTVCLPFTLAQEAPFPSDWSNLKNFSNDAHDPGGATMCGITQREYDVYRKSHGLPVQDVRRISREEGEDIYSGSYWLPHCPALPPGVDLCAFDSAVNEGPFAANQILQFVLGVSDDGIWGPRTAAAVEAISDIADVIKRFTARRRAVYRTLRGFPYFGDDWLRRASSIGATALTMTTAQTAIA